MKLFVTQPLIGLLSLTLLQVSLAHGADRGHVDLHVYVNDACIIADEPYFLPVAASKEGSDTMAPKFLPLVGLIVGKYAELLINHEIQGSANRIKARAGRKDTHYAMTKEMNLYHADLQSAPMLSVNASLGCMTILAANLKPDGTTCTDAYAPKALTKESIGLPNDQWKSSRADDSVENQLRRANVCVDGKAAAVYEARFEFSKDGTAYRLKDAGYRINTLLTTPDKSATRTALYTLKISQPGATDQQEVLSSAWVNIGEVKAGSQSSGHGGEGAPWLRTPPLSVEARRVYDEKTRVHQEVTGEIDALKRALTRNQRMLIGLDQRIAAAAVEIADGLKQERSRIAVQIEAQSAELDARNAEFQGLSHAPLEFMPVTIEVAVTETESEKKAQLALANIINSNSDVVASAVGNAASGAISKSVAVSDLKTDSDTSASDEELALTGNHYFDALIEVQTSAAGRARDAAQHDLLVATERYNDARRAVGLEPIK
jgi:hypothetical protein